MKMKCLLGAVVVCAAFSVCADVAGRPERKADACIRKASAAPFAGGQRVEAVWSRADTLCGFIIPGALDAAIDSTQAQLLHDANFLYISVRGRFAKGCGIRPVDRRLFRDNNIEVFAAPLEAKRTFRQFALSQEGLFYFGKCEDGARSELPRPEGVETKVSATDGCITYNVKFPLAALNLGNVAPGARIRLMVARNNVCFRDGHKEPSTWGAIPERWDYAKMEHWGEVVFAEDDGTPPATVNSPCDGLKVNYFANPRFDVPGRAWQTMGKGVTQRLETQPMSKEWIIRTTGASYNFLKGVPQVYERSTEYTLEVRARGYGGQSQMNILELYSRDEDGATREGTHIADHVVLDEKFHTYRFPFRSTGKGKPQCMFFYKWEPKNEEGRGIDIESVRMFKGKVNALELRKIVRSGRKVPVGAGVPVPPNPYGHVAKPPRGLMFIRHIRGRREIMEMFEGTGVEVDVLATTAKDQDIYCTDGDVEGIERNLRENRYAFFCIGPSIAANIGAEMAAKVIAAVKNGAGIYLMGIAGKGHFEEMLAESGTRPIGDGDPLAKSYPGSFGGRSSFDPAKHLLEGRYGKGRVMRETWNRPGSLKFTMDGEVYGTTDFPFSAFADPVMMKLFLRLSGLQDVSGAAVAKVEWRLSDPTGMIRADGEAADEAEALARAQASCTASGEYIVALKSVDRSGATVDWCARRFSKEGPSLTLAGERISCSGDESAVLRAEVNGGPGTGSVRWTLEDFSGRIIESGIAAPGAKFEVPTKALFTNKGIVRAYLVPRAELAQQTPGATLAVARMDIYARDRDWQRLGGDFGVGIWGQGTAVSRDSFPLVDRQLQNAGVLCQSLPIGYYSRPERRNITFAMSSGMAVGGGYLGNGDWFYPKQLGDTNVRSKYGPVNTRKGREQIAEYAHAVASKAAKYGPLAYAVCDEPNLSLRFTTDEPDEEPENVAEYRCRMEAKYGTIAEYNRRHGTSRASFAEIGPARIGEARRTGHFAECVEWRNFNVDRWCEAIKTVADGGKAGDPTCRLSLFETFGQTAVAGNDYWKLLTKAGLEFSNEYTSMVYMKRDPIYNFDAFYRSFRPDLRVWGFTGYSLNEIQIRFTPWWFALHRYGGFTWFAVMDWDWRFLDQPTLALTQDAADMKSALEKSRVQDGLGRLCIRYEWAPRQTAIYYSHESMLVSTLLGKERLSYEIGSSGPLHDYMYSRQGAQFTVEDLLYQFDFVAPAQVTAGKLDGVKALIMPRILALSDAEVAKLKAFVAAGGRILADCMPGDYDELGVKRQANPFAPSEVTVTGSNFDDLSPDCKKTVLGFLRASGAAPVLESEGAERLPGREAIHLTDGANDVFAVLRMPLKSSDSATQTFRFPAKRHIYDMRAQKYVGFTDSVTAAVPNGEACLWAALPAKTGKLDVSAPAQVAAGTDLVADIALEGAKGKGVFHVEVVPPSGECRFHMKRNLDATDGKARLVFRMAANDRTGTWTLRVTDVLTGTSVSRGFAVAAAR